MPDSREDLHTGLHRLCDLLARVLDRRIHVSLDVTELPGGEVATGALEDVLAPLVRRARDELDRGGELVIRALRDATEVRRMMMRLEVSALAPGSRVRLHAVVPVRWCPTSGTSTALPEGDESCRTASR